MIRNHAEAHSFLPKGRENESSIYLYIIWPIKFINEFLRENKIARSWWGESSSNHSYSNNKADSRGDPTVAPIPDAAAGCSTKALENQVRTTLNSKYPDKVYSFINERSDGRRFVVNSKATPLTEFESASTSKMVTAAIILRLVGQGVLRLSDTPDRYIKEWKTNQKNKITLHHLLSFTSGLTQEPKCINFPKASFDDCVLSIAKLNENTAKEPGTEFYYSSTHLQVAGLMAIRAKGYNYWNQIFDEFQRETKLFANARYDLPSETNPRLAGGMHFKGEEYIKFLKDLRYGNVISQQLMNRAYTDQIAQVSIGFSPALTGIKQDWHYGYGAWIECNSPKFNCTKTARMSSPGAFGSYPYIDFLNNYFGILVTDEGIGGFIKGYEIENTVRSLLVKWSQCKNI